MQRFATQAHAISTHHSIISRKGKKKSRNIKTALQALSDSEAIPLIRKTGPLPREEALSPC